MRLLLLELETVNDKPREHCGALFKVQAAGIDMHGVLRRAQRAAARLVSCSSRYSMSFRTSSKLASTPLASKLEHAALCALLSAGGEEYLEVGVKENNGADIASVHDDIVLTCKLALHLKQESS